MLRSVTPASTDHTADVATVHPRPRTGSGGRMRDLRISVTDRCNFRCVYCMPKEVFGKDYQFLERKELLTFEEIARLARIFSGLGVEKIRLTGGEPLDPAQPRAPDRDAGGDPRSRPHAHHQRLAPHAQGAGAEGRGPASASPSASTRWTTRRSGR